MISLYQAEWCPFSSAVRQRLTELGVDFVARQVEPEEGERTEVGEIPTLVTDDGVRHEGSAAVFGFLAGLEAGLFEQQHRQKLADHPDRDRTVAKLLAKKAPLE